ncbi:MAG: N,N-dimethylformamidase beta subunit family domain-containing protein [Acidimicrobiales bacterium]
MADDVTFYDEIEGYCGELSYVQGDELTLHVSAKTERFDVVIERWGAARTEVWRSDNVAAVFSPAPGDADSRGCRWPVSLTVEIADSWRSGFYLVTLTAIGASDGRNVAHAGFVVRPSRSNRRNDALLVLATNTWNAYNPWGGCSLYTGAVEVSFKRPMARGMLSREPVDRDDRKARPARWGETPDTDGEHFQRYRFANGYPAAIGSSGWYQYERLFVEWAEAQGIEFDYAISSDLEDGSVVEGYDQVIGVGHDEYWSAAQRDTVEEHVRSGGGYVSFSGNTMFWQVRIEAGPTGPHDTMVGYKYSAHELDPAIAAGHPESMTGMWADPLVNRPEASFLGGGSAWGLYSRFGQATARGSGAFTVYRPDHWIFANTGLGYGDLLGQKHGAVGYETLGCRIQFDEFQQPVRAGGDATPESLEIVAFTPASNCAIGEYPASISALNDQGDLEFIASRIHGGLDKESLDRARYGNSVIVTCRPFADEGGEVVAVGTTDWVFGLADDPAVAQVTRNILDYLRR